MRRSAKSPQRPETVTEKITVFVSTCQLHVTDGDGPSPLGTTLTAFKPTKFQALVRATATLSELQAFLMSQWMIAKSPYAEIPASEQFYTFKGRILRLDGTLDGYYIAPNDTIYIRFSSLGRILDPCAMSTSELRTELQARNAYVPKLQPEELMARLQEEVMRESRMQRLQRATKREDQRQVVSITKELARFHAVTRADGSTKSRDVVRCARSDNQFQQRPVSLAWPHPPAPNRTVFLSITQLERCYQAIPRDVLDTAIFVFDTERKWVFDKHNVLQKQSFDYKYMCFDADFIEFLTLKEEMGLVFWFRPTKSYEKLSVFFQTIEDPVTQLPYKPLILRETKWLTLCGINGWEGKLRQDGRKRDTTKVPKFTKSIARITSNIRSQSFEYLAVQELLYQSNATLLFAPL